MKQKSEIKRTGPELLKRLLRQREMSVFLIILLVVAIVAIVNPKFIQPSNMKSIALSVATDGLLSAFRAAGAELRSSAAASLCSHLIQNAPIVPICFKNGSVLTQWGRLSGLDPVRDNVFHGLENWVLDP